MFLTAGTARGDNVPPLRASKEGEQLVSPFERIRRLTKIGANFRQFRIIHGPWRRLPEEGAGINNTERAAYARRRGRATYGYAAYAPPIAEVDKKGRSFLLSYGGFI